MENRSHALATGAFIVLLGAVLVAVVAWFQGDHRELASYTVLARQGVPGLNLKAPVKLHGVPIGKVEQIAFDPAQPRQIRVTIEVEKSAPVTTATFARLGFQGITGLSFIDLSDAEGVVAQARPPELPIELRPSLFEQLSGDAPRLMAGVNEVALRLNGLLSDANQRELARALANLGDASSSVAQLAQSLRPAAAALQPLAQRGDHLLLEAERSLQRVDGLAGESTLLVQELRQRSLALDQMAVAARQLQQTTQRLELALVGANRLRQQPLVDELGLAARAVERSATGLGEQPQSLIFGRAQAAPGPGEPGFDAGRGGR
ncbi:MlaD family protein [Roseateles violae]|uniref:MlaD family protein n=1 Tax=Roseateles violae TaxID=3058042 RepID=A0ABT8DZE2_9BURK|nr:MlaD family protein [Pelomonas sp. PFR6]MDN3922965.1 MlaD family protein [Pelomonas sp. PFR6]